MKRLLWILPVGALCVLMLFIGMNCSGGQTPTIVVAGPATAPTTAPTTQEASLQQNQLVRALTGEGKITPEELLTMQLWVNTFKDIVFWAIGFIPRLLSAMFFFLFFFLLYRGIRKLVLGALKTGNVDQSIRDMFGALIKWVVMGFGLIIAFNQIGIEITALLTGVSIIGLAIGFAAQETLQNFIAGIVIFWDKPFRIGDWVEVDSVFGRVERVTFRSTRLRTLDGVVVVHPNAFMLNTRLINHSSAAKNRLRVEIGIAYKESIDKARSVLLAMFTGDARVCAEPSPSVVVNQCADSSVNLTVFFWIEDESQEYKMVFEYTEKAKKALDAAGIEIPFPHMQLFLEKTPMAEALAQPRPAA